MTISIGGLLKINSLLRRQSLDTETCHHLGRIKSMCKTSSEAVLARVALMPCQLNYFHCITSRIKKLEVSWITVICLIAKERASSAALSLWDQQVVSNVATLQMYCNQQAANLCKDLSQLLTTCDAISTCRYRHWTEQFRSQQSQLLKQPILGKYKRSQHNFQNRRSYRVTIKRWQRTIEPSTWRWSVSSPTWSKRMSSISSRTKKNTRAKSNNFWSE